MASPIDTLVKLKRLDADDGAVMRPLRMYHGEEVFSAVRDNRESLAEWLPWPDAVKGLSDTRDFIRTAMDQQADGAALQLGIWADGVFAGGIGLHAVDWDNGRTSLGYWLCEFARRHALVPSRTSCSATSRSTGRRYAAQRRISPAARSPRGSDTRKRERRGRTWSLAAATSIV